uniref:Integrin beta n=1 Tax=Denticeps clupeoides TaxID=299321 RepID=A0AAY4CHJ3_9TELE
MQNANSGKVCSKGAFNSCAECIVSGPNCAWCKKLNFTKTGEQEAVRCDTQENLKTRGCSETEIISPKNIQQATQKKPLTSSSSGSSDPVQIMPQEVKLELRPDMPETIELKFKRAEGYPVDLYYLMDLSYSMRDDLERVKSLGSEIVRVLQEITGGKGKARIGFGSFVDKTVLPFTNTNKEKLKWPCQDQNVQCQPPFGYKHVLSLTSEHQKFNDMVSKQFISGNLDSPEGGLDAMMQVSACEGRIGWGNSTRLLVLATDDGFHMAGDGKLAAILDPNDEKCHLDRENLYTKSNLLDYPSVGQLAMMLDKSNIQPIFAVTENVKSVYTELQKMIPKSAVGVLSGNSDNVVKLIKDAYSSLSSSVIVTHDTLPDTLSVAYKSNCPGGDKPGEEGICDKVGIGQEVTFYVQVTAKECIKPVSFNVGPRGFTEKMRVTVTTRCECECDDPPMKDNPHCNGKGQVKCGTCSCEEGYLGQRCKCSAGQRDEEQLRRECRKDNGTECEGRGDCVCGVCQCHETEGGKTYYGTHCECDDEHCHKYKSLLCGGNGRCRCGKCECNPEYEGNACHCKKSNEQCKTGQTVCNGRGTCQCDQCQCSRGYKEPMCLTCPGCTVPCQKNCIECLAFAEGPFQKNCSQACPTTKVKVVDRLTLSTEAKKCEVKDSKNCWMDFTMEELQGFDNYSVEVLREQRCPEPPNIVAIVAGSVAGVALIGLLILLIIKALIYIKDAKEWKNFQNEKKKSKWTNYDFLCLYASLIFSFISVFRLTIRCSKKRLLRWRIPHSLESEPRSRHSMKSLTYTCHF